MKKLKHPNLVHLHEVIDDDESDHLVAAGCDNGAAGQWHH
jgi:hypothetical protein